MSAELTPGPWVLQDDGCIEAANGGLLAFVHPYANVRTAMKYGEDFNHANGRLIAAAPQLLEACVGVLGSSTHRGQCIFCGARIDEEHAGYCQTIPLRAAIRAAREGK